MLTHVATLLGQDTDALFGVSDLDFVTGADGSLGLLASSRAGGGLTAFALSETGVASLGAHAGFPAGLSLLGGVQTAVVTVAGAQFAVPMGQAGSGGTTGFWGAEWSAGALGAMQSTGLTTTGLPNRLAGLEQIAADGQNLLIAAHLDGGISRFRIENDGTLTALAAPGETLPNVAPDTSVMAQATVGDTAFVVLGSGIHDTVTSYRIDPGGEMAFADVQGAPYGLGLNLPTAIVSAEVGGVTYIIVASTQASALTVFALSPTGAMTPTAHVLDTLNTRFDDVTALAVAQAGGRSWVAAGGSDDGITLFELLPGGRLLERATLPHQIGMTLMNPDALAMIERDGALHIFVGSASADGITQLSYDLGMSGVVLTTALGATRTDGTDGADTITGSDGNDKLAGWGGDDVIYGGIGEDTMWAGTGADVFILEGDGILDEIREFDATEDRLDLSGWGVMSPSQLTVYSTWNGGRVYFEDEYLIIITETWTPLTPEALAATLIDVSAEIALPQMRAGEVIYGTSGDDTLTGGVRDDLFVGMAGADAIIGGGGADTVSYEDSTGSLRVDLWFPHINTNVAAGDTYAGIEHLTGSQGADNLRGTTGDNHLQGMANVDYIFGRRGDDTLDGGVGDDVLLGGVGADQLIGGSGRDRAQYSESLEALIVDLSDPTRNTGEAAGDTYDSIEDLAGGKEADALWGDAGANRLFGREREDTLRGGAGDDYLNGGAHSDRLEGGAGDDTLRGGSHPDTFVFTQGHDVVEDMIIGVNIWNDDFLELEGALLWSGALSAQQVVDTYGGVVNGQVVLDFGAHSVTLQNLSSLEGLVEQLVIL